MHSATMAGSMSSFKILATFIERPIKKVNKKIGSRMLAIFPEETPVSKMMIGIEFSLFLPIKFFVQLAKVHKYRPSLLTLIYLVVLFINDWILSCLFYSTTLIPRLNLLASIRWGVLSFRTKRGKYPCIHHQLSSHGKMYCWRWFIYCWHLGT